jgi:hypothetical protein
MFQFIDSQDLRGYFVFMPMSEEDRVEHARALSASLKDPRFSHYWDGDKHAARLWQFVLNVEHSVGDMYMLYHPDAEWNEYPAFPHFQMHGKMEMGPFTPRFNRDDFDTKTRQLLDLLK